MSKKAVALMIAVMGSFGLNCNYEKEEYIEVNMNNIDLKTAEEIFNHEKTFQYDIQYNSSIKIYGANKIAEYDDTTLLFLDISGVSLIFINNEGKIIKKIGAKGPGPGEFDSIFDFTIDDDNNIYALDSEGNKAGKFNSKGEFVKNYRLSFTHRSPSSIAFNNAHFIIGAENNLTSGSTMQKYSFLDYSDVAYLNVYDLEFNYQKSFLNRGPEHAKTGGFFASEWETFAPFAMAQNKIIAMTQEGFYRIILFDENYKILRKYSILSKNFQNIDLKDIDHAISKEARRNYPMEKLSKILGKRSAPVSIFYSCPYLAIEIRKPLESFFTQYVKSYNPEFYIDILKLNEDKLLPIASCNIKGRLIGAGKDGVFYFFETDSLNEKYVRIIKRKMKVKN